jgi:hypothetical protein
MDGESRSISRVPKIKISCILRNLRGAVRHLFDDVPITNRNLTPSTDHPDI